MGDALLVFSLLALTTEGWGLCCLAVKGLVVEEGEELPNSETDFSILREEALTSLYLACIYM